MQYHAWFKEPVPESPLETERLHKCDIYFYLEDKTIQVVEHKQTNSGLPQGDMVKKLLIPKPEGGGFFTEKDLFVGAQVRTLSSGPLLQTGVLDIPFDKLPLSHLRQVKLFGKEFTIVDANESTRHYMSEVLGMNVPPALPYPNDSYTTYLTAKMQRETGADTTIPR